MGYVFIESPLEMQATNHWQMDTEKVRNIDAKHGPTLSVNKTRILLKNDTRSVPPKAQENQSQEHVSSEMLKSQLLSSRVHVVRIQQ